VKENRKYFGIVENILHLNMESSILTILTKPCVEAAPGLGNHIGTL